MSPADGSSAPGHRNLKAGATRWKRLTSPAKPLPTTGSRQRKQEPEQRSGEGGNPRGSGNRAARACSQPPIQGNGERGVQEGMPEQEFFVNMTCEGCSNAVTRVLSKLEGVQCFDIDLPNKKVMINSEHSVDKLLDTLKKTGMDVQFLGTK
uniref:Copper transport protein ATOX1 n=1 Tax=Geotrypetes seraphini TaxID=260995 RepID=A0A6P8Q7M5_GEOSA|nr:copper transport protein ATOX1 [Geotrypetes seraphini]